jgi:preprotein translocase subunit YajC
LNKSKSKRDEKGVMKNKWIQNWMIIMIIRFSFIFFIYNKNNNNNKEEKELISIFK